MKSTGEVMGIHTKFSGAFAKSQFASYNQLPLKGTAFLSVTDSDKADLLKIMKNLDKLPFKLIATSGTAKFLTENGYTVKTAIKVREGSPNIVDSIAAGEIDFIINTPEGSEPLLDSRSIRLVANEMKVPTYTTIAAAEAAVEAMHIMRDCLLYTSPSPRDATLSRMPSSA